MNFYINKCANPKNFIDKSRKKKKKEVNISYKKSKKGAGPPKRLESISPPELKAEKTTKDKKITDSKLKDAKKSLETFAETESPSPPMAPRITSQKTILKLESLKPPPPPPKIIKPAIDSVQNQRSQVISELKEIFMKRGLVTR